MTIYRDSQDPFKQIGVDINQGKYHEEMLYGLVLMYTAVYDEIAAFLKKYELLPGEMNVLMLIKHQGKEQGLSQVDIGRRLMVTAHNMTRLVQRLEKEGLIKRSSDQKDARINLVTVTIKASKLLDEIWPGYDEKMRQLAGRLAPKEQKAFSQMIQRWLNKA